MKYIKVEWPEIQDYMLLDCFNLKEVGYDPNLDCWFVPEEWTDDDKWNEIFK